MQDLRYEAITLETAYREILDSLKTSDLTAVTTTFITNVDRVYGLLRLPVVIPHVMGIIVNAVLSASGQIAGHTVSLNMVGLEKLLKDLVGELTALRNAEGQLSRSTAIDHLNAKLKALSDDNPETVRTACFFISVIINLTQAVTFSTTADGRVSVDINMSDTDVQGWAKAFGKIVAMAGTPARMGFEGVLSGSIIGTWTAIEALAGDLWEAALNSEPEILSKLNGLRRKKGKNDKQLDLNYIHRYKYSMRNVMGTILRKRFAFALLDGIVEAYEAAFSKDGTAVLDVMKDRALFRLSCVRNVIVHRGGLVDEEFHQKMKKEARFSGLQIGEAITIDGEATNELIGPAVRCGVRLIEEVDQWLASHPGKVR